MRIFFPARTIPGMAKTPTSVWGRRAHAAGLDQKTLAELAGVTANSVGRGLRGEFSGAVPGYLRALIVGWELMSERDRGRWLEAAAQAAAETEAGMPGKDT